MKLRAAGPVLAAAAVVAAVIGWRSVGQSATSDAPVLVLETRAEDGRSAALGSVPLVVDSLLLSLDEEARRSLGATLESVNTRLEARANPLGDDLEGGDPDDALKRWAAPHAGVLRAASAVSQSSFCATDGFCATPAARCPTGKRCVPLWGASSDPDADRARFLAWPVAQGVWLRAANDAERDHAVESLRVASAAPGSTVALVVAPADAEIETQDWARDMKRAWMKRLALGMIAREKRVPGAKPSHDLALAMTKTDILVVPRPSAVAHPEAVAAEVARIVPGLRVVAGPSAER